MSKRRRLLWQLLVQFSGEFKDLPISTPTFGKSAITCSLARAIALISVSIVLSSNSSVNDGGLLCRQRSAAPATRKHCPTHSRGWLRYRASGVPDTMG